MGPGGRAEAVVEAEADAPGAAPPSSTAVSAAVDVEATGSGQGVLIAVTPRRNLLSRSNGFRTKLLAANIDQIAIVVATSKIMSFVFDD